jgi:hypothetical protein
MSRIIILSTDFEIISILLVHAKSPTLVEPCDHSVEAEKLSLEALGYFPRRRSSSLVVRCGERV